MSSDATNFEWTDVHLGDIASIFPGFGFKSKDFQPSGIPIVKIKNVKAGEISLHSLDHVDFEFENTHQKYLVKKGDLLITLSGNRYDGSPETWVGKVAYFGHLGKFLLNQRVAFIRANDPCHVDHRFLSYLLSSYQYQYEFISIATSSGGQANLSSKQVNDVQLALPPYPEQKAIAHILGTLDDKIELNRQTNKTLEAMARAIFKSWFVDFDPVHAKRSKQGGGQRDATAAALSLSPVTLDLFPDSFQDSELGEIPVGWEVGTIGSFGTVTTGKTPPKSVENAFAAEGVPFITPTDVSDDPFITAPDRYLTADGVAAVRKSVLNAGSICVTCIGSQMGKTVMSPVECVTNQQLNSICVDNTDTTAYLFLTLRSRRDALLLLGSSGSTMPIVNKTTFQSLGTLIPPLEILTKFSECTDAFFKSILRNTGASQTLASLRDTLLPKLISGELRIKDAEKFLKEAPL